MNDKEWELRAQLFKLRKSMKSRTFRLILNIASLIYFILAFARNDWKLGVLSAFFFCWENMLRINDLERRK